MIMHRFSEENVPINYKSQFGFKVEIFGHK